MKCKVCGAESGKYPLCRVCNVKKDKGEIIKCSKCDNWHSVNAVCGQNNTFITNTVTSAFLYDSQERLISKSEQEYYKVILSVLPEGHYAFPQVNLASFIVKNDNSPFHNELFRNVDFLITNKDYKPLFIIEINDQTHFHGDRRDRDEKVQKICEEAGIPIVKFWTSYGINEDYIRKKISEALEALPVDRIQHFNKNTKGTNILPSAQEQQKSFGCYIATCVYGSYDCPEVWTLRRYRDYTLASTWYGRLFIKAYYLTSPTLVKWFGNSTWFHNLFAPLLNKFVCKLRSKGVDSSPYNDPNWN